MWLHATRVGGVAVFVVLGGLDRFVVRVGVRVVV